MKKEIEEEINRLWKKSQKKFEDKYRYIPKGDEPVERKKHCEEVFRIVELIIDKLNINDTLQEELKVAAKLHDIKKYKKHHAEEGAKYIKNKFKVKGLNVEKICEIVRYHSMPEDKNKWSKSNKEIANNEIRRAVFIIRVADKLSKDKNIKKNINEIVSEISRNLNEHIINEEEKLKVREIIINYYKDLVIKEFSKL